MQGIVWAVIQDPAALKLVIPRYEVVQCHHITLQYGVSLDRWWRWVGLEFTAIGLAECWNDRIQAVRVQLPAPILCVNQHPHITVSHQVGVAAKEANQMLADQYESVALNLIVPVWIEFAIRERPDFSIEHANL
jgi:hypothetical protein